VLNRRSAQPLDYRNDATLSIAGRSVDVEYFCGNRYSICRLTLPYSGSLCLITFIDRI